MQRNKSSLYCNAHVIDVINKNGLNCEKNILIQVAEYNNILEIKLRDNNEYSFNYTTKIDWPAFEKIKLEQCLEISYEEFKMQIVELLKQALSKEMLMKLETSDQQCRIIFYEKSRIKCLIFLTIDLELTNQREIIEEMTNNLIQMREMNRHLNSQLTCCRSEINEKEIGLRSAKQAQINLEKQFCQHLQFIEQSFVKSINCVEQKIGEQIQKINLRHLKLMCDLERVKSENKLKGESSSRLVQSLQNMRMENDKHHQTIRNLHMEMDNLNSLRNKSEKNCCELRQTLARRESDILDLKKELVEIRKDMTDATMIIAQKTKTHDELAKDLVQANTMIVNFNNHIDALSEELELLKAREEEKDRLLSHQNNELKAISEEYSRYKNECKLEEMKAMKHELLLQHQKIEELEKQNREASRLNGILTKKLAQGDYFDCRTMNWNQTPK